MITTFAIFLATAHHPAIHMMKRRHPAAHAQSRTLKSFAMYKGWDGAYHIDNGIVDVVIVPSIGRIMSYKLLGHPETDPIWNNPDELGKSPSATDWVNFGGDKTWPNPQDDWSKHGKMKSPWPPDPAFDSGPAQVCQIPNGIRLTNPLSKNFNLQLTREITLLPGETSVTIKDTFRRPKTDPNNEARLPVGLWNVTQTRSDGTIFIPLAKTGDGYIPLDGSGKAGETNWKVSSGMVVVTHHPDKSTKVGTTNNAGWMASLYSGNVLFAEHFTYERHGKYLDKGANAEAYTNPKPAYIEMETLGPGRLIPPGGSLTRTITWSLQHLPKQPASMDEAAAMITRRLSQR